MVLGRALLSARNDANKFWMLLSGNVLSLLLLLLLRTPVPLNANHVIKILPWIDQCNCSVMGAWRYKFSGLLLHFRIGYRVLGGLVGGAALSC
jgi:hypothetical protein